MAKLLSWFKHSFRESVFRNTGIPYRNLIGMILGSAASVLLLSSGVLAIRGVTLWFVVALIITALLLVLVRPYHEKRVDRFAWGLLVIIVLGFGLGALIYQYRHWIKWLWHQYLRINEPHELLLEALFLLGVILGFFVVRNWAKEQKDFVSSLSAVLGGAFVATILGKLQGEGINEIGALKAFAYYALGFTMSGTINLIAAARLTANYINKRSVASRAMLDFLYGSDRTKLIDGYFLKNFQEDTDYAKRWLTDTLNEYRKLIKLEFAEKMLERKTKREKERNKVVQEICNRANGVKALSNKTVTNESPRSEDPVSTGATPGGPDDPPSPPSTTQDLECLDLECLGFIRNYVTQARKQLECRREFAEGSADRKAVESSDECTVDELLKVVDQTWRELVELQKAVDEETELQTKLDSLKESKSQEIKNRLAELHPKTQGIKPKELECLKRILGRLKPSYYYELIAIECEEEKERGEKTAPAVPEKDRKYSVIYRSIVSSAQYAKDYLANRTTIKESMFRVGIAMRRQDKLEYIIAPGQYGAPFPVMGSVAGLALLMGQTIVMDRDKNKKFRSKDYGRGVCPVDIEQPRGLDEITFLSYFSIPIVARMGTPDENALGISNVDTRLFATRCPLPGEEVSGSEGVFRFHLTQAELSEYASNLYEENDESVKYVEEHTKIITPVLELYAKCRVGAI